MSQSETCTERSRSIRNPQSAMDVLERRAKALARPPTEEAAEGETLHVVAFPLGEERYGVEITMVQEVQPLEPHIWSRVPCTPDFIVGAVNIRGRVYSVMDAGRFLGLPSRPLSESGHVLLVRGEEGMELGILADDIPQVASVPLAEVQPALATISSRAQEYVRGVTNNMLIILNLPRLLSDPGIIVHEEV